MGNRGLKHIFHNKCMALVMTKIVVDTPSLFYMEKENRGLTHTFCGGRVAVEIFVLLWTSQSHFHMMKEADTRLHDNRLDILATLLSIDGAKSSSHQEHGKLMHSFASRASSLSGTKYVALCKIFSTTRALTEA